VSLNKSIQIVSEQGIKCSNDICNLTLTYLHSWHVTQDPMALLWQRWGLLIPDCVYLIHKWQAFIDMQ